MTEKAKKRLHWLDCWRFASALVIIWLHTPSSDELSHTTGFSRYAVPFFVASAAFMACKTRTDQVPFTKFVRSRIVRIYLPFLGWSILYFFARRFGASLFPSTHTFPLSWDLLWRGPTSHLWFLPFILLSTIFANLVGRIVTVQRKLAWPIIFTFVALSGLVIKYYDLLQGHSYVLDLSSNALPALFWGICLAIGTTQIGTSWLEKPSVVAVMYLVFASLEGLLVYFDRHPLIENLAGFVLVLCCFASCQNKWVTWISAKAPLAYGIYLSHMLFLEGFQDVGQYMGIPKMLPKI